jgi:hypothetical protein
MAQTLDKMGNVIENGYSTNLSPEQFAISTAQLAKQTPVNVAVPQVNDLSTLASTASAYTGSAFDQEQANVDAINKQAQSQTSDIANLQRQIGNKSSDLATQYQAVDETGTSVNSLAGKLRKLSAQSNALEADTLAKTLAEQNKATGQNITSTAVQRNIGDATRENAIKIAQLAMQSAIAKADYDTAKDYADQIVNAKYDKLQAEITAKLTNLAGLKDYSLTPAQKKQADAQTAKLLKEKQDNEDEREQKKGIENIGMTLRKYGVSDMVVKDVLSSENINDALIRAGNNLQDPAAKMELESIRLDQVLKKAQIQRQYRETQLLGEPTPAETKATAQAIKEAKSSIPVMNDKIDTINILKNHSGLSSRVGTSIQSRTPQGILGTLGKASTIVGLPSLLGDAGAKISGSGQDFAGGVHKLVGGLTLQSLIDAKARGATFGALSEGELNILANSASAINDWEIKDDKGKGTGVWNIDEKSFKKELETIENLTRRALLLSQGTQFTSDEQNVLDEMYGQSTQTNASAYFGQ